MIISASRRTDICAFYSRWFVNRLRAGHCCVPNPFNRNQVSDVSLKPQDVDVIVFWTRNARPMLAYLDELDRYGFRYYFQYTVNGYPRKIEPASPELAAAIRTFRDVSDRVGPQRVIWRYDPIILSPDTPVEYHRERFETIAAALEGKAERVVVSIVDDYRSARGRLKTLFGPNLAPYVGDIEEKTLAKLFGGVVEAAKRHKFKEVVSCAEKVDLSAYGIEHGKCIDDDLIERVFGIQVGRKKDENQREACGCVASKDIGMYDTCLYDCKYCYATHRKVNRDTVRGAHDPSSPSLFGWYEAKQEALIFDEEGVCELGAAGSSVSRGLRNRRLQASKSTIWQS
ncbi:MAG: DUF1848 domain-containing protein [Chthonomonadales bacterium]